MKLYFICACVYVVATSTNITPSLASSFCLTPSQYGLFQALVSGKCDVKSYVRQFESTCKECMYLDTQSRKYIGIDFNLEQHDARAIVTYFGADYDKIVNGPATAMGTPCDCKEVECLNLTQINNIFDESIENAAQNARQVLPIFDSLCCRMQSAIVDIAFAVGNSALSKYTEFFAWVNIQNWQAASDYLHASKWCHGQDYKRCLSDADIFQYNYCPCVLPKVECDGARSSCCEKSQTCCNATIPIKTDYETEKSYIFLCCPYPNARCYGTDNLKCCPSEYPVPCPPDLCCDSNSWCENGKCRSTSGTARETAAAGLITPPN